MVSRDEVIANLAAIRQRVGCAAARAGRDPEAVTIMAVTKGQPVEAVRLAVGAGLRVIGENRVQEAEGKLVGAGLGCEAHLIGHLQRNKARRAAELFACVQSIDSLETAAALSRAAAAGRRTIEILIEKNTSGADSQSGYRDEGRLLEDLAAMAALDGLRVRGLMTIAPLTGDEGRLRHGFGELRELLARAQDVVGGLDVLSMGMSGDYEIAVEEGATMIRLGTALFGARVHV